MELTVGSVVEGKITGITKFGAFVALPENKTGMVHISEVTNSFVSDINEHLKEGQTVTVKLIGIGENGRLSLSIKKAADATAAPAASSPRANTGAGGDRVFTRKQRGEPETFEDKLKQFMSDSESRISDLRAHGDKHGGSRRSRK